jgi:Protein of unknown function (DUF2458)
MVTFMSGELRNLGIPFFGIPASLIVDGGNVEEGQITAAQLRKFQSKMIDYLQSMYGPE